ncbi:hypothetical protein C4565_00520 [Candidatus Parcubacteria bacterium]|nr:MAG: hypothetical protein C4565_00520 [Candidatus Parcubacteria bacterium]
MYKTDEKGIQSFRPDNSENQFYIPYGAALSDIIEMAKEKWGDVSLESVCIHSEYIHTDCLGYDVYDSGDYTNYLRIEKMD